MTCRTPRLPLVAVLVLAGAACSSPPEADAPEVEVAGFGSVVETQEAAIEGCMRQLGFDYLAHLPADVLLEEAASRAERAGQDVAAAIGAVELPDDPKAVTRAELSEQERTAWDAAYWGQESTGEPGCAQQTDEAAPAITPQETAEDIDDRIARIRSDPRVVAAEADYLTCMHDAGHDVADQFEIYRLIDERTDFQDGEVPVPSDYEVAAEATRMACRAVHDAVNDQVDAEEFDFALETPGG